MKRLQILIVTLSLFLISCEKLKNENLIPVDAARLTELQGEYKNLLTDSEEGWYIEYAPTPDKGNVSILMKFYEDGTVSMLSDMYGFNEEKTSTFRVAGVTRPELIFDTYSVWSVIAENAGGKFEFLIYPQENGNFVLKNLFENTQTEYVLRKATAVDEEEIIARSVVSERLKDFNDNASAYFKNLILDHISAFWDININTQQLTLTWQEGEESIVKTFSYSNLPEGIRLAEEWVVSDIRVKEFEFGEATSNTLAVTAAGNAGAGQIEVAHVPAFPYKGTAKRYIWSNSFNPSQTPTRFLGYIGALTTAPTRVSPALLPYYEKLAEVRPGFAQVQVYNYNPVTGSTARTNSIQLAGGGAFHPYYYALDEIDESHVLTRKRNEVTTDHPQYGATYTLGDALTLYQNHPEIADFLDRIYPAEGVTIVPLAGQNVRVVSRSNSLYYFDLIISTPATFWTN